MYYIKLFDSALLLNYDDVIDFIFNYFFLRKYLCMKYFYFFIGIDKRRLFLKYFLIGFLDIYFDVDIL